MKKHIAALTIVCVLAVALGAAALTGRTGAVADATPAVPEQAEDAVSGRTEDAGQTEDIEAEPESEPETPALTLEDIRTTVFSDVSAGDEIADYVSYAGYRGFLQADEEGMFAPDGFVTRGELMSALWRMSGEDAPAYGGQFSDVSEDDPWAGAAAWAAERGIAAENADGAFLPQAAVSREELAVVLYRFAVPQDASGTSNVSLLEGYLDGGQAAESARAPLAWALENRLFAGMVSDTIFPALPVSRGQLAQVLTALAAYSSQEPLALSLAAQLDAKRVDSAVRARHEEVQQKIDAIAAKYGAMGLQVAVVEGGEVTDAFAYGWAVKDTTPMTPEYKIRSASITKVAVGMAAMILREEGAVDLDEGIGSYWGVTVQNPSYPDAAVSIRTLLSHSSSLKVLAWDVSRSRDNVRSVLQSASSYMKSAPGSSGAWGYNNYGFGVLGQTLELASRKYLDEILEDRIWSVLGIDAAFESGSVRDTDKLATLYEGEKVYTSHQTLLKNVRPSTLAATGDNYSGGMTISAPELARMAALLVNDGRCEGLRLLSEESVALLESDSGITISDGSHQALPLRFRDGLYGRDRLYYHTGSGYGVHNLLSYDPEAGDAVVVLTTGASGSKDGQGIYAVCGEITEYLYGVMKEAE